MASKKKSNYRLESNPFQRKEPKLIPQRVIFLSVEGILTEPSYFSHLSSMLMQTRNRHPILHIEVLSRGKKAGDNSLNHLVELLYEYLDLRESGNLVPEDVQISDFIDEEELHLYRYEPSKLSDERKNLLEDKLSEFGVDIAYRKYLDTLKNDGDCFGVVLDRDRNSHKRESIVTIIEKCEARGSSVYLTNPCFEFWLLLHLCDDNEIQQLKDEKYESLFLNSPISRNHTEVSKMVSKRAGHGKKIPFIVFKELYWPNIRMAIKHAKKFSLDLHSVIDNVGSNLPDLLELILGPELE